MEVQTAVVSSPVMGMIEVVSESEKKGTPDQGEQMVMAVKEKSVKLCEQDEMPDWFARNPHVLKGYRPVNSSAKDCLRSWSYVHNETINIFSHLLPGILAAVIGMIGWSYYFDFLYPNSHPMDKAVFAFYFSTVAICMSFSTCFHTLMNHSRYWALSLKLDYAGIITLALGDFISGIYVSFYCEPKLQTAYWTMFLSSSVAVALVVLTPWFEADDRRLLRLGAFMAPGLSASIPIAHMYWMYPASEVAKQTGVHYYLVEGLLLMVGAFFYGSRFPEGWAPGRYDIVGASHQLFHVCVVIATATHVMGLQMAFEYNYQKGGCSV